MINIKIDKSNKCNGEYSLYISFPYEPTIVNIMREQTIRYWHPDKKEWELPIKSFNKIKEQLTSYLDSNPNIKWVCIQGEGVGSVQGNPLKLEEDDLYVFNFIDSLNGRFGSYEGEKIIQKNCQNHNLIKQKQR